MNTPTNPLLLIGHGTRDPEGRQTFLDFAEAFAKEEPDRPVIPCFLELTEPSIAQGIDECVALGYKEIAALPVLLFAARHNKFDVTNELDKARLRYPDLKFYYGRHFGIAPNLLELWQKRLSEADESSSIPRSETVLLFVGRGASDPDANADVYKLARLVWEGSGFKGVEVCFTGITHPRLDPGFERLWTWQPKRVVVIPHFLFTGVLVKRIQDTATTQQQLHPDVEIQTLNEIGLDPILFDLVRERELEAIAGQVTMNCEMCKFRLAASQEAIDLAHTHHHHHHDHHHHHGESDRYAKEEQYHKLVWQVP